MVADAAESGDVEALEEGMRGLTVGDTALHQAALHGRARRLEVPQRLSKALISLGLGISERLKVTPTDADANSTQSTDPYSKTHVQRENEAAHVTPRADPATYYVSETGNDSSSGLWPSDAWQTISRANQVKLKPGDRLLFQGGKTFTGGLTLSKLLGTATQPIVVGSYGDGWATLRPPNANTPGIHIYNSGFLEVRNLCLSGVGSASADGVAVWVDAPGLSHLYLSELDVCGFAVGVNVQSSVKTYRDVRVTYSMLHDNSNTGVYFGGAHRGDLVDVYVGHCESFNHPEERGYGFYLFQVVNGLVERSVSHDNGACSRTPQAFSIQEADNITFRHCEAYRTTTAVHDAAGFLIDGGCTNSVIEYCYAHDNYGPGFQMTSYADSGARFAGNVIRYCVSINNGRGISAYGESAASPVADSAAYGNTVFADVTQLAKPQGQLYLLSHLSNWGMYNNLVVVSGDLPLVEAWIRSPASSVVSAGNAYWAVGAAPRFQINGVNFRSLDPWRGTTGWDSFEGLQTGVIADPQFQSGPCDASSVGIKGIDGLAETLAGWRLQAGSPLVDAGVDLEAVGLSPPGVDFFGNPAPQGAGYDVGACEVR